MGQDYSVICETVTTQAPGGITVGSGGTLGLASGSLVLTSGSLKITGGNVSIASGAALSIATGVTMSANVLTVPNSINVGAPGTASVSVATASGTSIPVALGVVRISATAVTTSGSCTLAVGATDGQLVTLINESANNILISGNIQKAVETVSATRGAQFCWISADTKWTMIGG